jgi:hypothetical protein
VEINDPEDTINDELLALDTLHFHHRQANVPETYEPDTNFESSPLTPADYLTSKSVYLIDKHFLCIICIK